MGEATPDCAFAQSTVSQLTDEVKRKRWTWEEAPNQRRKIRETMNQRDTSTKGAIMKVNTKGIITDMAGKKTIRDMKINGTHGDMEWGHT